MFKKIKNITVVIDYKLHDEKFGKIRKFVRFFFYYQ